MTSFKPQLGNYRDRSEFVNPRRSADAYRKKLQQDKEVAINEAAKHERGFYRPDVARSLGMNTSNRYGSISESNELYKEFKLNYLVNTLGEVFCESLVLDDNFVNAKKEGLIKLFGEQLANLAESPDALLEAMSNSNEYLRDVAEAVLSEAAKDAVDVAKEKDPEVKAEKKESKKDKTVNVYGGSEASSDIKNKVLEVLDKENEASEKEKAIQDELNAKSEEGTAAVSEAYYNTRGLKKNTLFRSIQIDTCKKGMSQAKELNEANTMVNLSEDGMSLNQKNVLGESIIRYTLFETFNTLGLKEYNAREVSKLSNEIAYKRY